MEEFAMKLVVTRRTILETIGLLQQAGRASRERMVLWFGKEEDKKVIVDHCFVPLQEVSKVSILIPRAGMKGILTEVKSTGCMVAAQVHSHPKEAFHSYADDHLAVLRHEGAISIVLPYFSFRTSLQSFCTDAACYRLSKDNEWQSVAIAQHVEIQ